MKESPDDPLALDAMEYNLLYFARKWADWQQAGKTEEANVYLEKWKAEALRYRVQWLKEDALYG